MSVMARMLNGRLDWCIADDKYFPLPKTKTTEENRESRKKRTPQFHGDGMLNGDSVCFRGSWHSSPSFAKMRERKKNRLFPPPTILT